MVTYSKHGHTLEFFRENSTMRVPIAEPDPTWSYTDAEGHEHRWQEDKLPSMAWVVDLQATDWWPEEGHHECVECGAPVEPRYIHAYKTEVIQGLEACFYDSKPIPVEEGRRILEGWFEPE